jgi:hypothetical protein
MGCEWECVKASEVEGTWEPGLEEEKGVQPVPMKQTKPTTHIL